MKTVLLAPTPPPRGGIAGWTERMLKTELKNGWQISVVDEKLLGKREVFGKNSKRNILNEIKRCFRIWNDLKEELKFDEVQVVQSCIPATTTAMMREFVCESITHRHKKKFIIHFRCTLPNMVKGKLAQIILLNFASKADGIFVLNQQSANFLEALGCKTSMEIIPNFIEDFKLQEKKIVRDTIKKLVYVGGVIPEKGCDIIISTAKMMPEKEFYLVGKNGMADIDAPPNVFFTDELDKNEVEKFLQDADVFLFVSRFYGEGFSNALAEAMAQGLPCIASDWAANRDMLEDKGGIILPVNTPEAVKEAIDLLEPRQKRISCGSWNVQKVLKCYTESIITSKYVDAYERICK